MRPRLGGAAHPEEGPGEQLAKFDRLGVALGHLGVAVEQAAERLGGAGQDRGCRRERCRATCLPETPSPAAGGVARPPVPPRPGDAASCSLGSRSRPLPRRGAWRAHRESGPGPVRPRVPCSRPTSRRHPVPDASAPRPGASSLRPGTTWPRGAGCKSRAPRRRGQAGPTIGPGAAARRDRPDAP